MDGVCSVVYAEQVNEEIMVFFDVPDDVVAENAIRDDGGDGVKSLRRYCGNNREAIYRIQY